MIIELLRNEKLQKHKIIQSQHTSYLHKWLVHFLIYVYYYYLYFFFWEIPKCVQT